MAAEGVQLGLFDIADENGDAIAEFEDGRVLANDLTIVRTWLISEAGLADSSAATELRHLVAMVRESDYRTARELFAEPGAVIRAIRSPERKAVRRERFRAACDALDAGLLPEGIADATRSSVLGAFPGRSTPRPALLDVDLGGSEKEVRVRILPSWEDVEAMIAAAHGDGNNPASARNAALVAVHGRSTLPPQAILDLDWGDLRDLLEQSGGTPVTFGLKLAHRGRVVRFEVHATAIDWLRKLSQADGSPRGGPAFSSIRRPRPRISESTAWKIINRAARAIGFQSLDRRHLRGGFGWWLKQQGWSELRLCDALGYQRVREVRNLLQPLEEAAAQTVASEFLTVLRAEPQIADFAAPQTTVPSDDGTSGPGRPARRDVLRE